MNLFSLLLPELLITAAALVLFLFGIVRGDTGRRIAPWIALAGLLAGAVTAGMQIGTGRSVYDFTQAVVNDAMTGYVKIVVALVGIVLLLLSWPTNEDATGNPALRFGLDAGEFFGLLLLSLVGIMLVVSANDTILLFMGIELASIPTYIMVAMSRPLPSAQEAGVKYFYLGAMSAAVMLLGFGYLYGAVGSTNLHETGAAFATERVSGLMNVSTWQTLAVILVLLGFCFKLAAVPLHFYAGDVYTGAATPVTALLSFVPKATGILATVKILVAVGGGAGGLGVELPGEIWKILFAIAVLTMTVGNMMALLTENLKRVMAYSSIAHSGYMLVALTVLAAAVPLAGDAGRRAATSAVTGVLFYLAAYGIMNAGVFGVLMMLPTRQRVADLDGTPRRLPATSAETYADIRGAGRRHPWLTVAMAVCCISLIGIPLTVGFLGKVYVLRPALLLSQAGGETSTIMWWLIGLTVVNAAIAAGYYLRILSEMILQPSPEEEDAIAEHQAYEPAPAPQQPWPLVAATTISVAGILLFGTLVPSLLNDYAERAALSASTPTRANFGVTAPDAERPARDSRGLGGMPAAPRPMLSREQLLAE